MSGKRYARHIGYTEDVAQDVAEQNQELLDQIEKKQAEVSKLAARRSALVAAAMKRGVPAAKLAEAMGVHPDVVYRLKRQADGGYSKKDERKSQRERTNRLAAEAREAGLTAE